MQTCAANIRVSPGLGAWGALSLVLNKAVNFVRAMRRDEKPVANREDGEANHYFE